MITADVIRDLRAVDQYREAWRDLFERSDRELSTSFEWSRTLTETHLRPGDEFFLIVLRDGSGVRAIVPLVGSHARIAGLPLNTIAPLSERYRTHSDLLAHPVDDEVVDALLDAMRALPWAWDVFRLMQVLEANPLIDTIARVAARRRMAVRLRGEPPSFFLPLPATYEAYLAARSSRFRNHLRRMEKKLAATGRIRMAAAGDGIDLEPALSAMLDIEAQSWKHAHGTAMSAVPHQARFYREMSAAMSAAGRLHLTLLLRDETPIAYNLGLVRAGQYAYLKTSFVETLKPLGPASVLRAWLIESLIAGGVRFLDFPAEPYEWEAQWTSAHRAHQSVLLYNRTVRARGYALLQRLRDSRRRETKGGEIVYANARDLRPPGDEA
jgi:CelD/BcsL family acetyltransferase involved in cellulose biosynthesis